MTTTTTPTISKRFTPGAESTAYSVDFHDGHRIDFIVTPTGAQTTPDFWGQRPATTYAAKVEVIDSTNGATTNVYDATYHGSIHDYENGTMPLAHEVAACVADELISYYVDPDEFADMLAGSLVAGDDAPTGAKVREVAKVIDDLNAAYPTGRAMYELANGVDDWYDDETLTFLFESAQYVSANYTRP